MAAIPKVEVTRGHLPFGNAYYPKVPIFGCNLAVEQVVTWGEKREKKCIFSPYYNGQHSSRSWSLPLGSIAKRGIPITCCVCLSIILSIVITVQSPITDQTGIVPQVVYLRSPEV